MAYFISEDCIACGDCYVVCPEKAIDDGYTAQPVGDNGSATSVWQGYRITGSCTECGNCLGICPTGAIQKK